MCSVLLNPAGGDFTSGEDKDGLLESLFKFGDELLVKRGEEDLAAAVRDVYQNERLIFLEADFGSFCETDVCGKLFALGVEVVDGLNESSSNLLFQMAQGLSRTKTTEVLVLRALSKTPAAFLTSVICG